ncbi:MAG: ABC transporter ATP-binding protein [bacterium]
MNSKTIIKVENVNKSFMLKKDKINVLKNVNLEVIKGQFVIIVGPSGCGKSTLLHVMLGLEKPDSGEVFIEGNNIYDISDEEMNFYRKRNIGMIYQQPNWVRSLDIEENVCLPAMMCGRMKDEALKRARELIDTVGMLDRAKSSPIDLSSGQQQKIAFARALMNDPAIIIADEPTGNLDHTSALEFMTLMDLEKKRGKTIIMVTHNLEYLKYADNQIHILDGSITQ